MSKKILSVALAGLVATAATGCSNTAPVEAPAKTSTANCASKSSCKSSCATKSGCKTSCAAKAACKSSCKSSCSSTKSGCKASGSCGSSDANGTWNYVPTSDLV